MKKQCEKEIKNTEKYLAKLCASKINTLKTCDEKEARCPCSLIGGTSGGESGFSYFSGC